MCSTPPGRKRSLGYARDDDTKGRTVSHSFSFLHVEGSPFGAVYPPPSARPFFKGLHNGYVKTLTLRKVSSPPYRHFERSEKSSLHDGQRESVRGGATEAPRETLIKSQSQCFPRMFFLRADLPLPHRNALTYPRKHRKGARRKRHRSSCFRQQRTHTPLPSRKQRVSHPSSSLS